MDHPSTAATSTETRPTRVIEVFADVVCPFTHVGLRRFVQRRAALGRTDVRLFVRAWPLEIVNGHPLDPHVTADRIAEIRRQVAPTLFAGFNESTFPATSAPALALAAAANATSLAVGEQVSLRVRDLLFEEGRDISDRSVLAEVAAEYGVTVAPANARQVLLDHAAGVARGVIGSPHFFTPTGDFFCPAIDVQHDPSGALVLAADPARFETFLTSCFE